MASFLHHIPSLILLAIISLVPNINGKTVSPSLSEPHQSHQPIENRSKMIYQDQTQQHQTYNASPNPQVANFEKKTSASSVISGAVQQPSIQAPPIVAAQPQQNAIAYGSPQPLSEYQPIQQEYQQGPNHQPQAAIISSNDYKYKRAHN